MSVPSLARLDSRYLLFRVRGERRVRRLTLPVAVGTAAACDIVVLSPTLPPLAYVISGMNGLARCHSAPTRAPLPLSSLAEIGIAVLGVVEGAAPARPSLSSRGREALAREAMRFAHRSSRIRRLLGGRLGQRGRLLAWAACLGVAMALLGVALRPATPRDLADLPLTLVFGTPRLAIIGASPHRHGYERGALLHVDLTAAAASQSMLVDFEAMALNEPGELRITLNDRTIFTSKVDPSCIDRPCRIQVAVPPGIATAGRNALRLIHTTPASPYMVQSLQIASLPALSADERQSVERWQQLARRFYDERHVVADNLLAARRNLERAADLLMHRAGAEDQLAAVRVLRDEVEVAFTAAARDAWAQAGVHARLGRPQEAVKTLRILLRLFPDPASAEHRAVRARLDAAEERQP